MQESATSPGSSCPGPARSPTSTPTSSAAPSVSAPTSCSRTTNHERPRRQAQPTRRPGASTDHDPDIWRQPEPLPDPEPVAPPTTSPPSSGRWASRRCAGGGSLAPYFATVVERAASVAAALALSAELPDAPLDDRRSNQRTRTARAEVLEPHVCSGEVVVASDDGDSGRSARRNVGAIAIMCPTTGEPVDTGMSMEPESFYRSVLTGNSCVVHTVAPPTSGRRPRPSSPEASPASFCQTARAPIGTPRRSCRPSSHVEPIDGRGPDRAAIEQPAASTDRDGRVEVADEEAGHAIGDQLGHRATARGRSPACRTPSPRRRCIRTARRNRSGGAALAAPSTADRSAALTGPR